MEYISKLILNKIVENPLLRLNDTLLSIAGRPPQRRRGTQVFVADSPDGPFEPFKNGPHTPENWMALDGTLWIEDYQPWMIFCHEWQQVRNGTIELVELKEDLSDVAGKPKTKEGGLLMIWSSFGEKGYAIGIAEAMNGEVTGPWIQQEKLLFAENGGHGMTFKTFEGKLMLVLHQPNTSPEERARFYELRETEGGIEIDIKN